MPPNKTAQMEEISGLKVLRRGPVKEARPCLRRGSPVVRKRIHLDPIAAIGGEVASGWVFMGVGTVWSQRMDRLRLAARTRPAAAGAGAPLSAILSQSQGLRVVRLAAWGS